MLSSSNVFNQIDVAHVQNDQALLREITCPDEERGRGSGSQGPYAPDAHKDVDQMEVDVTDPKAARGGAQPNGHMEVLSPEDLARRREA